MADTTGQNQSRSSFVDPRPDFCGARCRPEPRCPKTGEVIPPTSTQDFLWAHWKTAHRRRRYPIPLWRHITPEKTVCPAAPISRRCGRFVSENCFLPGFLE